eukprot:gene8542-8880_t
MAARPVKREDDSHYRATDVMLSMARPDQTRDAFNDMTLCRLPAAWLPPYGAMCKPSACPRAPRGPGPDADYLEYRAAAFRGARRGAAPAAALHA